MKKPKPNIGQAKLSTTRSANMSTERYAIEELLVSLPRGQTTTVELIAEHLGVNIRAARSRLQHMRHEGTAVNTAVRGVAAQWRLTATGRRALLGDEAWHAEEAKHARTLKANNTSVAGPRAPYPPAAEPGTLGPWAPGGNPVREGSMAAFSLPSRGNRV